MKILSFTKYSTSKNGKPSFKNQIINQPYKIINQASFIGTEKEKLQIVKKLLDPILKTSIIPTIQLSSAFLFHGIDINAVKNLVKNITEKLKTFDYLKLNILNIEIGPDESFISNITKQTEKLKNIDDKSYKTLIIMDEPEKYLGLSLEKAKKFLNISLDEKEEKLLNNNDNNENIMFFKSFLDHCSRPFEENGYNTSFLFSTNKPHLIHPDISSWKMEKFELSRIPDFKVLETITHLFKNIKYSLPYSIDSKESQIFDKLDLNDNPFLTKRLLNLVKTNPTNGAYSEQDIMNIVNNLAISLIKDPNANANLLLAYNLASIDRSIKPEEIVKYHQISRMFKTSIYKQLTERSQYDTLSAKEEKFLKNLSDIREFDSFLLNEIQKKRELTIFEADYLQALKSKD